MKLKCIPALVLALASSPLFALDVSDIENISFDQAYSRHKQGDKLTALAEIMTARELKQLGGEQVAVELFLADQLVREGAPREAMSVYLTLAKRADSRDTSNLAWLEFAKLSHEEGNHKQALKALSKIKGSLGDAQQEERKLIEVHALLASDKLEAAVKALPKISDESIWAMYQYFNFGVELMARNSRKHGALVLHNLSILDVGKSAQRTAVRDQAALALGFALMEMNKPARARAYFDKVRLDGHLSDIALLGMGWTYSQSGDFEKALIYWLELQERASNSAYAYESLLSVPYAYSKAGAYKQSIEQYKQSEQRIQEELQRLADARGSIEKGNLQALVSAMPIDELAWTEQLDELSNALERRVMPLLMANPEFQNSLMEYRSLQRLDIHVRRMELQLDALQELPPVHSAGPEVQVLNERYKTLRQQTYLALNANQQQLEQLALDILERYRAQLESYVEQVSFGMAQAIEGAVTSSGGVR